MSIFDFFRPKKGEAKRDRGADTAAGGAVVGGGTNTKRDDTIKEQLNEVNEGGWFDSSGADASGGDGGGAGGGE